MLKEAFLAGMGAVYLTKDKAEKIAQELIKRGELAKEDRSDFVARLMDDMEKQKSRLKEKFEEELNSMVKEANLITRDEYNELLSKVNELNARIVELENKLNKD
ncbi:MAG: hypothetical protein QME46_03050 [Thermoanaerobacteraceae bacterium]|nr:hypothetical protein [Thermoanaerobacteraceae bacterium]